MDNNQTNFWPANLRQREVLDAHAVLKRVYSALKVKGYDPITQLVGYLTTGDPTYITNYDSARSTICRVDREDLVEELLNLYLKKLDSELDE